MTRTTLFRQSFGLLGWVGATFSAAAIGAWASTDAAEFYKSLTSPDWGPPAWLFGPVWTTLYALMAIAAWLVWRRAGFVGARIALSLYSIQLVANALWTWLFFSWRLGAFAFVEIVLLWVMIAATLVLFWRQHKLAGLLLVPYLAWVSFAAALNFSLWRLNPGEPQLAKVKTNRPTFRAHLQKEHLQDRDMMLSFRWAQVQGTNSPLGSRSFRAGISASLAAFTPVYPQLF